MALAHQLAASPIFAHTLAGRAIILIVSPSASIWFFILAWSNFLFQRDVKLAKKRANRLHPLMALCTLMEADCFSVAFPTHLPRLTRTPGRGNLVGSNNASVPPSSEGSLGIALSPQGGVSPGHNLSWQGASCALTGRVFPPRLALSQHSQFGGRERSDGPLYVLPGGPRTGDTALSPVWTDPARAADRPAPSERRSFRQCIFRLDRDAR